MSRDIRKLFQKNVRGKLSEQGNGGFFEQEDRKKVQIGGRGNSVRNREKPTEQGEESHRKRAKHLYKWQGQGVKSLSFRQVVRLFSLQRKPPPETGRRTGKIATNS